MKTLIFLLLTGLTAMAANYSPMADGALVLVDGTNTLRLKGGNVVINSSTFTLMTSATSSVNGITASYSGGVLTITGTPTLISGTIPATQVSGTVGFSGTSSYSSTSGTATYSTTAGSAPIYTGTTLFVAITGTYTLPQFGVTTSSGTWGFAQRPANNALYEYLWGTQIQTRTTTGIYDDIIRICNSGLTLQGGVLTTTGTAGISTGKLTLTGTITLSGTDSAPVDAVNAVGWRNVVIGSGTYKIPVYQ